MSSLPQTWKIKKIKEFSVIVTGNTPPTKDQDNFGEDYPWITPTDITSKKEIYTSARKLSKQGYAIARALPKGTVLITSIASIGKNAILMSDGSCNQQINAILPSENHDSDFIYYWFEKNTQVLQNLSGKTAVPILNKTDFSNIQLPLPPLPEQQKIAEILSTVDQKIDSIDSKIEETQTLKRGLMQRLLSEGIGHSEFKESEIGRIPMGWRVVTLKEVIKELTGGVSVNSEDRIKHENEFGILKTSAIQNGFFYPMAHKTILETEIERATTNPLADHIIFSRMNTPDLVGESGYVDIDYSDLFLPDRLWQIDVKDRNITHVKWLSYVLVSIEVKKKIKSAATGTSNSMKNISKPSLLKISFALPPLDEQKQIAEILSTTNDKLESLRAKKETFETLKKGLMQKLLSGEVRV